MSDLNSSTSSTPSTPSTKKSIAIITTHPIQYNAPLFKYLAQSNQFSIKVFYTWGEKSTHVYDPGFGKERSWDIDLLSGYEYTFVENTSTAPGSHHYRGIINPDLINQIVAYKPDALLVYGWKFHSHLKLMRHFHGKIPILFRGDSTLLSEKYRFSIKRKLRKLFLKWVYKHVDFAISPGSASDYYFKFFGLPEKNIIRAHHAIDNERFIGEKLDENVNHSQSFDLQAQLWSDSLGLGKEIKIFMYAGKYDEVKNPLLLIEAFRQLQNYNNEIHLIIAGEGPLKSKIETELNSLDSKSYTLLGFQNQSKMPILYRISNIFMLTSVSETWGLALNEAMACGRAVIASDKCGGASDLIEDGKNGYIFKSGDVDHLVEKMKLCLENDRYVQMGYYSREKIKEFSYESFFMALNKLF